MDQLPRFLQDPGQAGLKLDGIDILRYVGGVIDRVSLIIRGREGVAYETRFTVGLVYGGEAGDFQPLAEVF